MSVNTELKYKLSQFTLIKPLGSGAFGQVSLYEDEQKQKYAIKKIQLNVTNKLNATFLQNELSALQLLKDSPYVVKYYGYFIEDGFVYIIQEYLEGHEGYEYVALHNNDFKKKTYLFYHTALNLIDGLIDIHNKHIVYMDLKLENIILLSKPEQYNQEKITVKYIDFGISRSITDKNTPLPSYDPTFYPEEHIYHQFGFATDVYALGKMFQTMLTGSRDDEQQNDIRYYPMVTGIRKLLPLFQRMTSYDKNLRPTLQEVKDEITKQLSQIKK